MTEHVIVDGYNLAYRCLYAPGMSEMLDNQNRPTGVLYGFLRVLVSLAKKLPGAKMHVAWDGSSQRRKQKFAGYKANRTSTPIVASTSDGQRWDQVQWLRETLPLLGLSQSYNPEEEADDVIASLARVTFAGQGSVILSNDRDLLQLLSGNVRILVPSQGKRKEALYSTDTLMEEWGVGPEDIVTLRALLGDASDNIPGVPRVPRAILTDLVARYHTLNAIYSSNLASLTKLQFKLLRDAEPQVRLNVDLMTLQDVPYLDIHPAPDQIAATERLADVDVNVEPMLAAFYGQQAINTEEDV